MAESENAKKKKTVKTDSNKKGGKAKNKSSHSKKTSTKKPVIVKTENKKKSEKKKKVEKKQPKKNLKKKTSQKTPGKQKKLRIIILSLISILVIGLSLFAYGFYNQKEEEEEKLQEKEQIRKEAVEENFEKYQQKHSETLDVLNHSLELKTNSELAKVESQEKLKEAVDNIIEEIETLDEEIDNTIIFLRNADQKFYNQTKTELSSLREYLDEEVDSLEAYYCANSPLKKFVSNSNKIEKSLEDLGTIIYLDDSTAEKMTNLSKLYSALSVDIEEGRDCFDKIEDTQEAKKKFESEKNKYEELSAIYSEKAKYAGDIEKFNMAGKDFDSAFLVYYEKYISSWLEQNVNLTTTNIGYMESDYSKLQERYEAAISD